MKNLIRKQAKNLASDIEIYRNNGYQMINELHTDTLDFVGFDLDEIDEEDIIEFEIVEPEEYNKTIYANCGEKQDVPVMVVLIKQREVD